MAEVFHNDQARGVASQLVFQEETTYGTVAGTTGLELPLTSDAIQNNINTFESEIIRTDRSIAQIREGNYRPDGDINTELVISHVPTLIKHALGYYGGSTSFDIGSAGGGTFSGLAQQYQHYLRGSSTSESVGGNAGGLQPESRAADGATTARSLSFEKQFTFPGETIEEYSLLYTGCRINQWSFSVPTEGIVTTNFSFMGANETLFSGAAGSFQFDTVTAAPTTPDDIGLSPFTSFEFEVKEGAAGTSPTVVLDEIQSCDFTLENNIFGDNFRTAQRSRINLLEGRRRITGSMTLVFTSTSSFYSYFLNSATNPRALRFEFKQYGATSAEDPVAQIIIEMKYVKYVGAPATPVIPGEGPIAITIPFQVYRGDPAVPDIEVWIITSASGI